jgi:hypothetical protein
MSGLCGPLISFVRCTFGFFSSHFKHNPNNPSITSQNVCKTAIFKLFISFYCLNKPAIKEIPMKYSKKLIVTAATLGTVGAAGIGATAIAVTSSSSSNYPPIVQKVASTFGLDPAKVNDVFKQQRQENMQSRQAKLKSTLDQAVKDGKLTQDQEDKLIAELKTLHDQNKTDKRQDRLNMHSRLEQWAKDNGINNLDQILPPQGAGMGIHRHMMDNDGDGDADDNDTSHN